MKPKIKEVIVVEGKDDVSALRRAVEADILITTGLGLTEKRIEEIRVMAERQGVIVFTDPDFPGGKIRHILKDKIPGCKHAYITKDEARCPKTGKYGVEYASPEAILRALKAAKAEQQEYEVIYELNDDIHTLDLEFSGEGPDFTTENKEDESYKRQVLDIMRQQIAIVVPGIDVSRITYENIQNAKNASVKIEVPYTLLGKECKCEIIVDDYEEWNIDITYGKE